MNSMSLVLSTLTYFKDVLKELAEIRKPIKPLGGFKGYDLRFPFQLFQNIRFPPIVTVDLSYRIVPNLFSYQRGKRDGCDIVFM